MALLSTEIHRAGETPRPPHANPGRAYAAVAAAGLAGLAAAHGLAFAAPGIATWLPAFLAYAAASALTGWLLARHFPHDELGWCNAVTQARLAIVAALLTPLAAGSAGGWGVFAAALGALALDGVDGWLARRQRLASAFGARFDMEVDSALALVLALNALASGAAGPVVLVLGLARYAFALAGHALPWLAEPLPERLGRKAVCVLQIGVLIALQAPVLPDWAAPAATVAAALALVWSFGRDVAWLAARAPGRAWGA